MADPFEYDVFLSFSSEDEEIVKPIWQELCSNGLRVFWSDSTLKKEVGNSWFDVIEKSLERSKHMLLVCSENSIHSKWVQREYKAFFEYCYTPNLRRLIPLLTHGFKPNNLPMFLRELQVGKIDDHDFFQKIIPILGGTNIEQLRFENQSLKEQVSSLLLENKSLMEKLTLEIESNRQNQQTSQSQKDKLELLDKQVRTLKNKRAREHLGQAKLLRALLHLRGLYVGNLPDTVSDEDLRSYFSQVGAVTEAVVITDVVDGSSTGFGYVEMATDKDAEAAVTQFHDNYWNGRQLWVIFSHRDTEYDEEALARVQAKAEAEAYARAEAVATEARARADELARQLRDRDRDSSGRDAT